MPDEFWDRIEPHNRSESLEEGLQARVADPLWMLARQWQMGEFRGEDAASPIHARLELVSTPIETYRNQAVASPQTEAFADGTPLEARVEAEQVVNGPAALRLAAEAGVQFLRRLDAVGLAPLRSALRAAFPLEVAEADLELLPDREAHRLRLLARRAVDGRSLLAASVDELQAMAETDSDAELLLQIHGVWSAETRDRFLEPGGGGDAWADERLEYSFQVAAAMSSGETILTSEHAGGHLDWYSFDIAAGADSHGLASQTVAPQLKNRLPVPLTYSGMPASRWWELEEGAVYFGGIEAGPADLGRLLVAEFATIYSDDWFLVPLSLPAGSLARVRSLEIVDTFGGVHPVQATAVLDQQEVGAGNLRPWSYFELGGDLSATAGATPLMLIPPTVAGSLHGKATEEVSFARDEAANLAWAIEQTIETPNGSPLRRRLEHSLALRAARDGGQPMVDGPSADEPWRWRLQSQVPPYWIPLIPERVAPDSAEIRLRRGRLLAWEELDPAVAGPKGRILAPERPLRLYEEEIPHSGVQVSRSWQAARGADGRLYLWMARRKRPGRGEPGSGLKFDAMER